MQRYMTFNELDELNKIISDGIDKQDCVACKLRENHIAEPWMLWTVKPGTIIPLCGKHLNAKFLTIPEPKEVIKGE